MSNYLEELRSLMLAESADLTQEYVDFELNLLCGNDELEVSLARRAMVGALVNFANERMYSLNSHDLPLDSFLITETGISYRIEQYDIEFTGRFSGMNEWAESVLYLHGLIRSGDKEAIGYFIEELR